ncbi:MAG: hemerythrin domain-containing protein [Comamonadaceae bacterium]|nr:MAG: hemerythrin domain-containing protein [Comamonadaceae bacterium]
MRHPSSGTPDAVALLEGEHVAVEALFHEFNQLVEQGGCPLARREIADRIGRQLLIHAVIEEEVFYPALRRVTQDAYLMDEAEVEHEAAKNLIFEVVAMSPDDFRFDAKVQVLCEVVDLHVEHERRWMFPMALDSGLDLAELGRQLASRRARLEALPWEELAPLTVLR